MSKVRYGVVAVAAFAFGGIGVTARAADRERDAEVRSAETGKDHYWEALRVEREHRERIARLHRLHELAGQRQDSNRLDELDRLEDQLRAGHAERMAELRRHMDDRDAGRLDEALAEHQEKDRRRADRHDQVVERRESGAGRRDRVHDRRDEREIRAAARQRAEQRWIESRTETGVKVHAAAPISHATSRLAEKRWREEARDRSDERWERAVRRSGILGDVPPSRITDVPTQQQLDAEIGHRITDEDADREFEQLLKELEE